MEQTRRNRIDSETWGSSANTNTARPRAWGANGAGDLMDYIAIGERKNRSKGGGKVAAGRQPRLCERQKESPRLEALGKRNHKRAR